MDLEIISGIKKGDPKAQRLLYDKYKSTMYVVCMRYFTYSEDAKDALQDGFVKVFRDANQYDAERANISTWMKKVFVNTCLEKIRKKRIDWQSLDDGLHIIDDTPTPIAELSLLEITKMIQKLPIGYRTVFNLYVIEGFTHAEIAEQLGITESTSKTQLMKAKSILKKKLEESFN